MKHRAILFLLGSMAVLMLDTDGLAKKKPVLIQEYQAYDGPALPQDQVATLDLGEMDIMLVTVDGHDLYHEWSSGRLRDGCKPAKYPYGPNKDPYRCLLAHLLIKVLPGSHVIEVDMFFPGRVEFTPIIGTPTLGCIQARDPEFSSCNMRRKIKVDAAKIYEVHADYPSGPFAIEREMFYVFEKGKPEGPRQ